MGWLATTADHRKSPRALWDEAKSVILLGVNYSRLGDPLAILQQRSRGAISIYAQGADYHEVIKAKLKQLATRARNFLGGEVKIFVDTAPVMEKPLAAQSGAWLAGQAHQSRLARVRLMAVHRLDLHERSDRARRARAGSLRGLPALPRCLPDRRLHRSLSDRCARVHLIPHHRAQGAHRAALSRGHGQPHLRLRRLPRRLPLEQIRARRARGETRGEGGKRRSAALRAARA